MLALRVGLGVLIIGGLLGIAGWGARGVIAQSAPASKLDQFRDVRPDGSGGDSSAVAEVNPTPTPTASATPLENAIPIQAGWTNLALPDRGVGPYTAASMLAELAAQGFGSTQVARWEAGRWESYVIGFPANDFPIEPGRGYFVRTNIGGTWTPGLIQQPATPTATPTGTARPIDPYEPNNTRASAYPIVTDGRAYHGAIAGPTDLDFFSFDVTQIGATIQARLERVMNCERKRRVGAISDDRARLLFRLARSHFSVVHNRL